jgi:predicted phosphoribosyltransferase/pimeloyl-ACP methyl ester carboxylesterase
MSFRDRVDAGQRLGEFLKGLGLQDPVVIGLPRGGVVVAAEVARLLGAPLDVVVVRKLGAPGRPELGIGAIGEGGVQALNDDLIDLLAVTDPQLAEIEAREAEELSRRVLVYRGDRGPVPVEGRTVVVIDDGLATGYTARAALRVLRNRKPAQLILAVPVSARDTVRALRQEADEVIALESPIGFGAVGQWYRDFHQTSDDEVIRLLEDAKAFDAAVRREVWISIDEGRLPGLLSVPTSSRGLVVFAHGSGSSRHSPRNQAVAEALHTAGFGTLLFDLLTDDEARNRANVFNTNLLANRLVLALDWVSLSSGLTLPIGLFGASTGAAAALLASIDRPVSTVVCRGGRPDLVGPRLSEVTVPVLLIVGSRDPEVLDLNRSAAEGMSGPCEVSVVPGAGHLFEEGDALSDVAGRAIDWFARWLDPNGRR